MIKYIKRSSLDIEKYNACIENAINSRIYAFSWYLDIVADNWGVLVLNDYKAVMPLPWRSKYMIKYIYTPCWTQQLGVFLPNNISSELLDDFIKNIPKKFKKATINFNSVNPINNANIVGRINYILPLNKPYEELFKAYKYVRRRCINQLKLTKIVIVKIGNPKEVIQLFIDRKHDNINLNKLDYNKLEMLINTFSNFKNIDIIVAGNYKDELLGGAFFLKDSKRITYLFSSTSKEGRKEQVMTYIIDSLIQKYANTNLTLDFEGSMIPGIAFFFRSFGAKEEKYFNYQKRMFF